MTSIPLRIAEPTSRYRRCLRRYGTVNATRCPLTGYHNAETTIGEVGEAEHAEAHGDSWPHDDPRWPKACACGHWFTEDDGWQRNDNAIYQLPDGEQFAFWGSFGKIAPPGTMIRATWHDEFTRHPDGLESWLISLPDGGEWITSQAASDGNYWTVSGTVPLITVTPSIWHNAPDGWHGWIRSGMLEPA